MDLLLFTHLLERCPFYFFIHALALLIYTLTLHSLEIT